MSPGRRALLLLPLISVAIGVAGVLAYAGVPGATQLNPYADDQFLIGLANLGVGWYIAARRPDHRIGWILVIAGTAVWMTFAGSIGLAWLAGHASWPEWLLRTMLHLSSPGWLVTRGCLLILVPLVFPVSRPASRFARRVWWVGVATIAITAAAHSRVFTFEHFQGRAPSAFERFAADVELWGQRAMWFLAVLAAVEMLTRIAQLQPALRRMYAPFAAVVAFTLVPSGVQLFSAAFDVTVSWADDRHELWASMALPVVLAVGILRHGLLDIRVVLRRATVYALLIAAAAVVYSAVIGVVSVFVTASATTTTRSAVLATGVIAAASVPAYVRIERLVARHLFGRRDAPFAAVAALGERFESSHDHDDVLELVAATVAEQLRLPYVAIEVSPTDDDRPSRLANVGTPVGPVEDFPLVFQGVAIGSLRAGTRSERDRFGASERAVLVDLARLAGVVAQSARVTDALRRSRVALVAAREEERRRLRTDLHDGLGPTLAGVGLGLSVAADRLEADPDLARLLRDLDAELQAAIQDIRRVVQGLRPPNLDELGLVGAISQHADRVSRRAGAAGPQVCVDAPDPLPQLPAAIEVAAFRVVMEAITNVVRHAQASRCDVTITCHDHLTIAIVDNGRGLIRSVDGVGLTSIRDRIADAGGRLRISNNGGHGTRIDMRLPVAEALP